MSNAISEKKFTPAQRIANQRATIDRQSKQIDEAHKEIEALKVKIGKRDETIAQMVKQAGEQRAAHRAVIEMLLDRYDVEDPRTLTGTMSLTFNGDEMSADWLKPR